MYNFRLLFILVLFCCGIVAIVCEPTEDVLIEHV